MFGTTFKIWIFEIFFILEIGENLLIFEINGSELCIVYNIENLDFQTHLYLFFKEMAEN